MENPPQPQNMIINTRSSLQVQSQIVENSNPELVPEKIQSTLQSTSTTAPSAVEVCVDIPLEDPHQDMIINTRSSRKKTTAPPAENDDVQKFIRRVPTHMHEDSSGHLYEPVMVSIGPYHHNKPQYSKMERFKKWELNRFMEKSVAKDKTKDRDFYYGKIFERIDEIRSYYEEVGPDKYSNEALTKLILCDACFLVSYMKSPILIRKGILSDLGSASIYINVEPDLFRVENQIPFFIISQLLHLRFSADEARKIVREFVSLICFSGGTQLNSLPWDEAHQPLHLIEACQTTLWKRETASEPNTQSGDPDQSKLEKYNTLNRSVTYLQTKGIYLRRSSESLEDITFTSHRFYGVLHLPTFFVDNNTMVLLQNLVAFEDSPEGFYRDVASYVNFMNNLINTSKDVKQLRERGILYSDLRTDEEVFKVFKQINTYGIINYRVFDDVKRKINKHCESRSKTWIADLLQNYCRGPWAAIGILAATAVLCLTVTQTYYAIHPKQ